PQHAEQLAECLGHQEVVQQAQAVVAHVGVLVSEPLPRCGDCRKAHAKEGAVRGGRPISDTELVNQCCGLYRRFVTPADSWTSQLICITRLAHRGSPYAMSP